VVRIALSAIGIIGALGFPYQDAVFDINVPGTGTGTVDTMGGADFFIVLPAAPIKIFPLPLATANLCPVISGFFLLAAILFAAWAKKTKLIQKRSIRHLISPRHVVDGNDETQFA
jgi:hypothetical protein